jgi:hypothetical protein
MVVEQNEDSLSPVYPYGFLSSSTLAKSAPTYMAMTIQPRSVYARVVIPPQLKPSRLGIVLHGRRRILMFQKKFEERIV